MKKLYKKFSICLIFSCITFGVFAQQPGLIINRFFTNPSGDDSPFEFAELLATQNIDFSINPYTIVFADGGNGGTQGWATGGSTTYAFEINAGNAKPGDLIYVGGSGLIINGSSCKILRSINTSTTPGDGFGDPNNGGVLGNGGSNADGIAVFNLPQSFITSRLLPVDAVFFGSSIGDAATIKFTLPLNNDHYNGGFFGASGDDFLAPDPSSNEYVYATNGVFDTTRFVWTTPRSFSVNNEIPSCNATSLISLVASNSLVFEFDTAFAKGYLIPQYVSGVMNDPTDPASTSGIHLTVYNKYTALNPSDYSITASSNNTAVVLNNKILINKESGAAQVYITPSGVGYADINLTLNSGGFSKTLVVNYAASASSTHPDSTYWHTGKSDASAALALDSNYMVIGDDESNYLYVFNRHHSGLPLSSFYFGDKLALTDGAPDFKEVDVEACVPSPTIKGRSYWIGSMSNSSSFKDKPNRNRLFAVDLIGSGESTAFSFTGYTATLRNQLIAWGDNNGYQFSTSAAAGQDSKQIDGFNIEGMTFAPDNSTLYIGFRAPLEPVTSRSKAVIAPLQNFEAWFNNGNPTGNINIANPIELDLGNRGVRDLFEMSNGKYLIIAGNYAELPLMPAIFSWDGTTGSQPVLQSGYNITDLNAEGVMEDTIGNFAALQLVSDNGDIDFYNDGTEAKDLLHDNFKKFRSDIIKNTGRVLATNFISFSVSSFNNNVNIAFAAEADKNDVFEIRRYNAGSSYKTIALIAAVTGNNNYNFFDKNLTTGFYYYQVVRKSYNGSDAYSSMKSVNIFSNNAIAVLPNPVTGNYITLTTSNNDAGKEIRLYNTSGVLVKHLFMNSTSLKILTQELPKGTYLILVTSNNGLIGTKKILIL